MYEKKKSLHIILLRYYFPEKLSFIQIFLTLVTMEWIQPCWDILDQHERKSRSNVCTKDLENSTLCEFITLKLHIKNQGQLCEMVISTSTSANKKMQCYE